MYKVKIFTVTLALMLFVGAAQAQNRSQGITPQQIVEQCPDFPSVETLVLENMYSLNADDLYGEPFRAKVERAWNEVKNFRDSIGALRERGNETARAQEAAMQDNARQEGNRLADNMARQQTGRSVKQLQNMSDKEAEAMAGGIVQQRMAAAGLGNMTLEDLESLEGKSDEEILQAMQGGTYATGRTRRQDLRGVYEWGGYKGAVGSRPVQVRRGEAGLPDGMFHPLAWSCGVDV